MTVRHRDDQDAVRLDRVQDGIREDFRQAPPDILLQNPPALRGGRNLSHDRLNACHEPQGSA
jgi:hypothetical protein